MSSTADATATESAYGGRGPLVMAVTWAEAALALGLVIARLFAASTRQGELRWDFLWIAIAMVSLFTEPVTVTDSSGPGHNHSWLLDKRSSIRLGQSRDGLDYPRHHHYAQMGLGGHQSRHLCKYLCQNRHHLIATYPSRPDTQEEGLLSAFPLDHQCLDYSFHRYLDILPMHPGQEALGLHNHYRTVQVETHGNQNRLLLWR